MEGDRSGGCYSPLLTEGFGGGVEGYGVQKDTLTLYSKEKGQDQAHFEFPESTASPVSYPSSANSFSYRLLGKQFPEF